MMGKPRQAAQTWPDFHHRKRISSPNGIRRLPDRSGDASGSTDAIDRYASALSTRIAMPDAAPVLDHYDLILRPDPSRTVVRPFQLEYPGRFNAPEHSRAQAIVDRVMTLGDDRLDCELKLI